MDQQAINALKQAVIPLAREYDLKFIFLYGSQASGKANADSDIDIAVLGNHYLLPDPFLGIINDLADLLQSKNVDVKSLHDVSPLFRYQVTGKGILLYGKSFDYHSYKAYAFKAYHDSRSLLILQEKMIKKRLKYAHQ
ncbi:nucleotidyltransferase family protein [Candidatus Margulisiibacteriota bacterium]